ncbi:MAG: preprotein translocase subunit YajC, partial [Oscillospiraceae bacterium]
QWGSLLLLGGMFAVMYFVLLRPQKKREKKQVEMRNSIEVGDGVTTIGGIVGIVVSTKEETVLLETGADRTRIRFKRWAVQDVEKFNLEETVKPSDAEAKTTTKK